jgi:hypothetical protein
MVSPRALTSPNLRDMRWLGAVARRGARVYVFVSGVRFGGGHTRAPRARRIPSTRYTKLVLVVAGPDV